MLKAAVADLQRQRDLLSAINESIDISRLLSFMGEFIQDEMALEGVLVNLVDEPQRNLVCEYIRLPEAFAAVEATYLHFKFPMNLLDVNVGVFKSQQSTRLDAETVANYPGTTRNRFERWRMQSLVVVPLALGQVCIGTVMVFSTDRVLADDTEERLAELLEPFKKQVRNALLYKRMRDREKEVRLASKANKEFLKFIERINNLSSTSSIYDLITEEFLRRFPFDLSAVLMLERNRLEVRRLCVIDDAYREVQLKVAQLFVGEGYELDQAAGATPTAFLQNTLLYFPDAADIADLPMSEMDRASLSTMKTPRTVLLVPIRHQNRPIGVLWLVSLDRPVSLAEQEKELLELLCAFIGSAITNAELYNVVDSQRSEIEALNRSLQEKLEELQRVASVDNLTGLQNFGSFQSELVRRMNEYQRDSKKNRLSLVIIDVDHFKQFNDTYGHVAGNKVLSEIGERLQQCARRMDIPCRYGGEEFVVILPKCEAEGARVFGERVRKSIEAHAIDIGGEEVHVTVSVGCATFENDEDALVFLDRADRALYNAKKNGRNRVETAG